MPYVLQRVAHRGGSLLAPENTLAAFRHALALGVDALELDVQMTCDGKTIVFHDNTVERLTNGQGNILDLDFAYLRSLNAAGVDSLTTDRPDLFAQGSFSRETPR